MVGARSWAVVCGRERPGIQLDREVLVWVLARGPFEEAHPVAELDRLMALITDDPWAIWVVLPNRVAVLAHRTYVRIARVCDARCRHAHPILARTPTTTDVILDPVTPFESSSSACASSCFTHRADRAGRFDRE
jgi:hypothetical protein